ncbi:MAG: hypothetical protein GWN00_23110 [Aliifodinibius sp.]|nr:hypothetical protein [Fodinibius sp.]NIY27590.1 hypothetical protein [Fodinibius sp.]
MPRMNAVERHPDSELIMTQLLQGKLTHEEAAEIVGCSRENITHIMSNTRRKIRDNSKIIEFKKVSSGPKSQKMLVQDLEGNVQESLQNIQKRDDGTYDFDAIEALKAIFVRLEKELIGTADFDIQAKGSIMKLQVDLATKLANMEPPEEKININELLEQSDRIRQFVPWLDDKLSDEYPELDVRDLFLEFLDELDPEA